MNIILAQQMMMASASANLWTPADLATPPNIWCNDSSAVTDDGSGNASVWADLSGNGLDMLQSGSESARPLIVANGLNGRRILRFDGTNDLMGNSATAGLFRNVGTGFLFAVASRAALDATPIVRPLIYESVGTSNNPRAAIYLGRGVSPANCAAAGGARLDSDAPTVVNNTVALDTTAHILLGVFDWTNHTVTLYQDGAQVAQSTAFGTGGNTSDTDSENYLVIGGTLPGNASTAADIGEIAAGSTYLLTSGDIDKLFGYAAWHWGLQANLPAGHPYKAAAP